MSKKNYTGSYSRPFGSIKSPSGSRGGSHFRWSPLVLVFGVTATGVLALTWFAEVTRECEAPIIVPDGKAETFLLEGMNIDIINATGPEAMVVFDGSKEKPNWIVSLTKARRAVKVGDQEIELLENGDVAVQGERCRK